jgi:hypothetical protein
MKKTVFPLLLIALLNVIVLCAQTSNRAGYPKSDADSFTKETNLIIDTVSLKYFPLAVGNVYKYFYGFSSGNNYYFKVRIVKDTVIDSKRYFITSQAMPGYGYSAGLLRVDSATGNILQRVNTGYCTSTPFELLRDSLRARLGDSTFVCPQNNNKRYCYDTSYMTLIGNSVKVKRFSDYYAGVWTTITYGLNFGIINFTYTTIEGMSAQSLVGCYINGVLYGDTLLTNVEKISSEVPSAYSLKQNYPNPFNSMCNVQFSMHNAGNVKLVVYDVQGREVQTLVNESLHPGTYETTFDGSMLPSGVYFYTLITDSFKMTRRLLLIK